jgi:hypothetical protein
MIKSVPKFINRSITMIYSNSEMRLDQLIGYLNEDKVNLSPVFQRGHVWKLVTRRKLVRNIVQGRPIPAIFIYREPSGKKYTYNILDGKQRIESLILFIGNQEAGDLHIKQWTKFFHLAEDRKHVNFRVDLPEGKKKFSQLPDEDIRELGEYLIPTIFITLTADTPLDEVIDLFVDINQEGEPVKRFDVVKAIGEENPLLQSVFDLLAREEERQSDMAYKMKNNEFTDVLKRLTLIDKIHNANARVDRMWERLLEIASFVRTGKHRQPSEILKSFIKNRQQRDSDPEPKLSSSERKQLRTVFRFIKSFYLAGGKNTPLSTDQTHFYTMTTAIIADGLIEEYGAEDLIQRLLKFGTRMEEKPTKDSIGKKISIYLDISRKQTTHLGRREDRQEKFVELLGLMQ